MAAIRCTGRVRPFPFTRNMPEGRNSQVFPKHLFSFPSYSLLLDHTAVNIFSFTDVHCYNPDSTRVHAVTTFNFRRFGWSFYLSINISYNPISPKICTMRWTTCNNFPLLELELDDKGCFRSNLWVESLGRYYSNFWMIYYTLGSCTVFGLA